MTNAINNNNNNVTNTTGWEVEDIFSASFMFPTAHFESQDELEKTEEYDRNYLFQTLIETGADYFTDTDKERLRKAVHSGNKLRLYYNILNALQSSTEALNATQETCLNVEEVDTDEMMDHNGVTIKDSYQVDEHLEGEELEQYMAKFG